MVSVYKWHGGTIYMKGTKALIAPSENQRYYAEERVRIAEDFDLSRLTLKPEFQFNLEEREALALIENTCFFQSEQLIAQEFFV